MGSNVRETCERIINLAIEISALGRSLKDHHGSGADTEELGSCYKRLKAEIEDLDGFAAHSCGLQKSCHILASTLLLRISLSEHTARYAEGFLECIWSHDSLKALDDRIDGLGRELRRLQGSDSVDRSRSLWTSGEQVLPRAGLTYDGTQRLASLYADDDNDEGEASEADIQATLRNEDRTEMLQELFIESLAFPSMNDREIEVAEAHRRTFGWIFDDVSAPDLAEQATSSFVSWLATLNWGQLYWINGKAGSGKSTLLRFLARHVKTREALQQWAGNSDLIILSFFFWTGGTSIQRSEAGLLRLLLHQLLSQRREMIPWTFSRLWLPLQDTKTRVKMVLTWAVPELIRAFRIALRLVAEHAKICLFIDGLDEFDGSEDTVIDFVRSIVKNSSNVKVCVSSRPWAAFDKAFEHVPNMLLQDLTDADMRLYVRDKFLSNSKTMQIAHDSDLGPLYADIQRQANGVFLWTTLATQHVHANAEHGSSLETLQAAVSSLPSDLEDLFRYLLFANRSELALEEQSCLLRIIQAQDDVCSFTGDEEARYTSLPATSRFRGTNDRHSSPYSALRSGGNPSSLQQPSRRIA